MPLFFLLSGAVFHVKPVGRFDSFLQKKSCRLLLPYFAAGLLFMFPVKLLGNYYTIRTLPKAVGSFMTGIGDSGHLWFLAALFWCMTLFATLLKFMERANCQSLGVVFFASLLMQTLIPYLPFDFLGMKRGAEGLVWFALGYCLDSLRGWLEKQKMSRLVLLLFITFAFFMAAYGLSRTVDMWPSYTTILSGCAAVVLLAQICTMAAGTLEQTNGYRLFTRNMFHIYLFHDPINYLILRVFMANGWLRYGAMCVVYFLARTIGVIVASIALGEGWSRVWLLLKQSVNKCPEKGSLLNV